ncbi:hypothetical protein PVK06_028897 [Gossypium arboreum]|uniref:RNase H type-1 domain-containing protein n=1 Tax=Gossypium arboreum TaxID=29729 RepID=A0ABR0P542_GOSAR|nr:hypothetical protein PVK06_028897 [Gossypium arboreum]
MAYDNFHATFNVFWDNEVLFKKRHYGDCIWIARKDGIYLRTFAKKAELWDVGEGLCLAKSFGIQRLIAELDSLMVVTFLRNAYDDSHLLGTLIWDCLVLIREGWEMEVRHILREGNKCVDHLANSASSLIPLL